MQETEEEEKLLDEIMKLIDYPDKYPHIKTSNFEYEGSKVKSFRIDFSGFEK